MQTISCTVVVVLLKRKIGGWEKASYGKFFCDTDKKGCCTCPSELVLSMAYVAECISIASGCGVPNQGEVQCGCTVDGVLRCTKRFDETMRFQLPALTMAAVSVFLSARERL